MVTGSSANSVRQDAEAVLRPDPRRHAGQIFSWVICWPWDLAWTLFVNNPLKQFIVLVVSEIKSTLDEITRGELRGIELDLHCDTALPVPAPIAPAPAPVTASTAAMAVDGSLNPATSQVVPEAVAQRAANDAAATQPPTRKPGEIGPLGPLYVVDPWYATSAPHQGQGWQVGSDGSSVGGSRYTPNNGRSQ